MPLAALKSEEEEKKEKKEPTPSPAKTTPKKPVVQPKPIEKFGTQTEKAKIIYVFRNGDKHHEGVKMSVHPKKFKTFDQV